MTAALASASATPRRDAWPRTAKAVPKTPPQMRPMPIQAAGDSVSPSQSIPNAATSAGASPRIRG